MAGSEGRGLEKEVGQGEGHQAKVDGKAALRGPPGALLAIRQVRLLPAVRSKKLYFMKMQL